MKYVARAVRAPLSTGRRTGLCPQSGETDDCIKPNTATDQRIKTGYQETDTPGAIAKAVEPQVRRNSRADPEGFWLAAPHSAGRDILAA